MTYGEAIALILELEDEWTSHLAAKLKGWTIPASYGDVMQALSAQALLTLVKSPDSGPMEPLMMPWTPAPEPAATQAEADALRADLASRSAFRE